MRRREFLAALGAVMLPVPAYAMHGEPFGLTLRGDSQVRDILVGMTPAGWANIERIATLVQTKHAQQPMGWINQLVQLCPDLGAHNECGPKAVAKCLVAKRLGYSSRFVRGGTPWGSKTVDHSMAAVQFGGTWLMMDNQHIIAHYDTPTDTVVAGYVGDKRFSVTSVTKI
jgi:hypothetical protein